MRNPITLGRKRFSFRTGDQVSPQRAPLAVICIVLHDPPLRRPPGRQIEARVVLSGHSAKPSIRLTRYKYPPQHVHRSFEYEQNE